ncbi:carnitine/acyl carnitine carrier [Cryptococcus gattii E566]|uniref:Carnitine/acyl carnitine carrier n=1 Tax=Cryptococcus gattii EJB2 TaxID=1296103 RepID=A0ABR5BV62_9TREE|nr:carnitine/acyl carnitine carrier [Cryptococcus gattii EJB2]KIY37248.1 carnitine/acyl carnitine carrier [Cryptococcus gattii E566]KJE03144.1 carnitine/acyl carnitine carrier [Cryptococcus gattii NT-10]
MSDRNGESSKGALISNSASSNSIKNGKGNDKGDINGEISPAIDFTAGIIAGVTGLIVGQPFDVVKVRYQTPQYIGRYGSTFSALGAIVKEEKIGGLFKGVTSPMAGIAFINGVVFTSYSFFMKLQLPEGSAEEPTLGQIFLAGTGSGVVASVLTCPTELIKIRQQSAPPHLNLTTFGVFKSIVRADGLKGIFRGFSATALRDVAYGPYFCTYEATLRFLKWMKKPPLPPSHHNPGHERHTLIDEAQLERHSGLRWPELMLAGGIAGVLAWMVTFPIDVFKTRMQSTVWPDSTSNSTAKPKLQSFRQVAADALRKEGWRVMFAGLGPTLIRAVPTNMVIFLTFEGCIAALS